MPSSISRGGHNQEIVYNRLVANAMNDRRKAAEIAHDRRIASHAEHVWNRSSHAGRRRLENRFRDLESFLGASMNGRMLEIGCGTGAWTRYLARLPLQIVALELSPDLLDLAKQTVSERNVEIKLGDAEYTEYPSASFDYVCGLSVLHHLELRQALSEMYRLLKPGGRLWFSEPNMLNPQIMIQKNVPIIKRWSGDTPDETAFFRWPLRRRLEEAGFRKISVTPIDFLHPQIPAFATQAADSFGRWLEKVPVIREIAGSLIIHAEK